MPANVGLFRMEAVPTIVRERFVVPANASLGRDDD
jgi:hypothetical protein